jgi:hypothetical protein
VRLGKLSLAAGETRKRLKVRLGGRGVGVQTHPVAPAETVTFAGELHDDCVTVAVRRRLEPSSPIEPAACT